ncbi:sugar phosphate isomerase/epimerase family protein [Terracidiphilus sp.]|uniref:sugar phosphate isomerase/epimerase family protein n=1 Tax=Terracidiphilus sp. TaxID=1964191 RepID=UPI003C283DD8
MAGLAAPLMAAPLAAKKKIPVSLELYSLRDEAGKDLPGTLAAIRKMGYDGIELVCEKGGLVSNETLWERPFKDVAAIIQDHGLNVYSMHHSFSLFQDDQLERTIEINQMIGNRNLICSWLNPTTTIAPWYEHAKAFNAIQAKLQKHGMNVGLHNHDAELKPVEGKLPWDVFMDNTVQGVTGQMHLAWFPASGLDPIAYIRKYPGRSRTLQLNDWASAGGQTVLLGDGKIDWKSLFAAAESVGGIEVYVIEQESYPAGMAHLEACRRCLENFRELHG